MVSAFRFLGSNINYTIKPCLIRPGSFDLWIWNRIKSHPRSPIGGHVTFLMTKRAEWVRPEKRRQMLKKEQAWNKPLGFCVSVCVCVVGRVWWILQIDWENVITARETKLSTAIRLVTVHRRVPLLQEQLTQLMYLIIIIIHLFKSIHC